MSVLTAAARWISGRAKLATDLPAAELALANIEASKPHSIEKAEHAAWLEKCDAARRDVEAIRGALAIATAEAAKAEQAQQELDADAAHAAAEKAARADERLVRNALAAIEKAVAEIEAVSASIARTDAANATRGSRPGIVDAERRLREIPGRTIPPIYEEREFWKDGAGNSPTVFVTDPATGATRPFEGGFTKVVEKVCVQPERTIPAHMPDRLSELLPALRKALGA